MPAAVVTAKPSDFIRSYQVHAPVDVKKIANDLGLTIKESNDMPHGASGMLMPDPLSFSRYAIVVNASDSYTRQRFTIAHEIAHFLLHRNEIRNGIIDDTLYRSEHLSGTQETEANKFAADILMPYDLIQMLTMKGAATLDQLANKLGVSQQAMSIRLGIPLP